MADQEAKVADLVLEGEADTAKAKEDALQEETIHFDYDGDDVKKLVRKLDWRIIPFLWGYAVLSAVDVSIARSSVRACWRINTDNTENHYIQCSSLWNEKRQSSCGPRI